MEEKGSRRRPPALQEPPSDLCFRFARLAGGSKEQIRRFAQRWGPLGIDPRSEEHLDQWRQYASLAAALHVLHDRDTKFCASFRAILATGNVKCLALPPRSPNLNAFAERWARSVKQECLSKLILFGEGSLRRALTEFLEHYHAERNHQGKGNVLLFPANDTPHATTPRCRQRLGGLLNYYGRVA